MILKGKEFTFKQGFCLSLYYGFLRYLPSSTFPLLGAVFKKMRYSCCKHIFKKCGKNVNIERLAVFGSGIDIQIGDYSGIGYNCTLPGNTIIGNYVMMGPNCYVLGANHAFDDIKKPMIFQGHSQKKITVIEDDVWIGRNVNMISGRTIKKGSIIAIGCVLVKDFPEYSIVGGNPSIFIKRRKE